jgi:hypothetical protein
LIGREHVPEATLTESFPKLVDTEARTGRQAGHRVLFRSVPPQEILELRAQHRVAFATGIEERSALGVAEIDALEEERFEATKAVV